MNSSNDGARRETCRYWEGLPDELKERCIQVHEQLQLLCPDEQTAAKLDCSSIRVAIKTVIISAVRCTDNESVLSEVLAYVAADRPTRKLLESLSRPEAIRLPWNLESVSSELLQLFIAY